MSTSQADSRTQVTVNPDALGNLTNRVVMTKDQFLTLPDEARMRAFTIARVTEADVLQTTLVAVRSTIEKGGTLWDFKQNFPDIAKAYTEDGRDWHLNLIFTQNARQAFAVGAYQSRQRNKRAFPYVEYQTGVNPRQAHLALNRKIFGVDDPFLHTHTPPWDFNCNCDLIPRTAAQVGKAREADQERQLEAQQVVEGNPKLESLRDRNKMPMGERVPGGAPGAGSLYPVDVRPANERPDGGGYSFRPDRLNQPIDLSGYDEEIRQGLIEQLKTVGYQLSADGQSLLPGPVPGISAHKFNVRPSRIASPLKAAHGTTPGAQGGERRIGRPMGRIGRPAPQIARVGRVFKEAA